MINATGRENSSQKKKKKAETVTQPSYFQRLGMPKLDSGFPLSRLLGRASWRHSARRPGALHVWNLKSQNPPGTPNPRNPLRRSTRIPSRLTTDATKLGNWGERPQHSPSTISPVGRGPFLNCSYQNLRILSDTASTEDPVSVCDGMVSASLYSPPLFLALRRNGSAGH